MKVAVYEGLETGEIRMFSYVSNPTKHEGFIGFTEINMELPKTVVKDAFPDNSRSDFTGTFYMIPWNAKNVKCTYEIEE